jgi:hypothetical protein
VFVNKCDHICCEPFCNKEYTWFPVEVRYIVLCFHSCVLTSAATEIHDVGAGSCRPLSRGTGKWWF